MIIDIVLGFAQGRGGLESVLSLVSNELVRRGHRVRVFQSAPPTYSEWEATLPEIYYYDPVKAGFAEEYEGEIDIFRYSIGYRKLIDRLGAPDVVFATHAPLLSPICKLALSHLGTQRPPILSWLHGPPEAYGGGEYLKYSDAHIAISHNVAAKIKSFSNKPIYYVGNPADVQEAMLVPRVTEKLKMISIGRLDNNQKRLDLLFKALHFLEGEFELKIIGDGHDGEALQKLAIQYGVSQHIEWVGWKDQPWKEVSEASLLVLPSDYEGFGLVLVEALARGIPVVATNCEGPDEIVKEDVNGWLFPVGDYLTLTSILQSILDKERELPLPEECVESISSYRIGSVVDRIERAILYTDAFYDSKHGK